MKINRIITLLFAAICGLQVSAKLPLPPLKTGDLLFQNLDCGPLCDAIEEVTNGYRGQDFSHIGLVYVNGDSIWIIEAVGKDVHLTSLQNFEARSTHPLLAARVKPAYTAIAVEAVEVALSYTGIPYDDAFIYNNGKYYCSEMIYDAFKKANNAKPFFRLSPMTFRAPGNKQFFPVWISYYKELGMAIPEGKEGINPGGISLSHKLTILN